MTYEEREQALALMMLLAEGNRQIEAGDFRPVEDVFAELDADDER
ncbi:hypothetical protein LFL97_22010 [Burkholderia sp. JSH-S8]|nr:hypothetical protein LFL97_22010 [Burkholderia sp. JSH-S8]